MLWKVIESFVFIENWNLIICPKMYESSRNQLCIDCDVATAILRQVRKLKVYVWLFVTPWFYVIGGLWCTVIGTFWSSLLFWELDVVPLIGSLCYRLSCFLIVRHPHVRNFNSVISIDVLRLNLMWLASLTLGALQGESWSIYRRNSRWPHSSSPAPG